jgi:hypothetical protein
MTFLVNPVLRIPCRKTSAREGSGERGGRGKETKRERILYPNIWPRNCVTFSTKIPLLHFADTTHLQIYCFSAVGQKE